MSTHKDDEGNRRTSMAMGIEVVRNGEDGFLSVLVEAKTLLSQPVRRTKVFGTHEDDQTTCFIEVRVSLYLIILEVDQF